MAKTITEKKPSKKKASKNEILFELAWEVCNQVGGIYTVIRSKVPAMVDKWGGNYCLIGPYVEASAMVEFEEIHQPDDSIFAQTAKALADQGYAVKYGEWLITGKPKIILLDFNQMLYKVDELKGQLWENHGISTLNAEKLVDHVVAFGELVRLYLTEFAAQNAAKNKILVHFHEWMAATALPDLKRQKTKLATVFTTHATMLGRYIAGNVDDFYQQLDTFDWAHEAQHYGIEAQAGIERAAAQAANVLTTVSEVTAKECKVFFGRTVDFNLPNGLNITRFTAGHEFQNLHHKYKMKINEFVMGHFFQSHSFDLDNTLFFFTSGRFEFKNKGYDLTLEALRRLNFRLVQEDNNVTVVMFIITRNPYHHMDPEVLQSRAMMEEIRSTTKAMEHEIGNQLFHASAANADTNLPDLNQFVTEYWQLRLRRLIQSWKTKKLPKTTTHILKAPDGITEFFERTGLQNHEKDRVKFVYHPDFVAATNPLFGLDYSQFVRGCHLGVFPSSYEPWGYTPLECVVRGVPTVTSDLSGFGEFIESVMSDPENVGIYVVKRNNRTFEQAADQLANQLYDFIQLNRKERIHLRNAVENIADTFDWNSFRSYYDDAHEEAFKRAK